MLFRELLLDAGQDQSELFMVCFIAVTV
jgi:hypothetical protein